MLSCWEDIELFSILTLLVLVGYLNVILLGRCNIVYFESGRLLILISFLESCGIIYFLKLFVRPLRTEVYFYSNSSGICCTCFIIRSICTSLLIPCHAFRMGQYFTTGERLLMKERTTHLLALTR